MSIKFSKVLVVGPAWIGDMVMAQSLFILLKQQNPDALIDVVAPAWTRPLLARMPEVRRAVEMPFGHGVFKPLGRFAVGRELRAEGYDWAIVLPITWKSAIVPFGARIPRRTGFVGELRFGLLNDLRKLDKQRLPMMVQRYLALGLPANAGIPDPLPEPRLVTNETGLRLALERHGLNLDAGPVLAVCAGAEYGPAKQWPAAHYAEVARAKLAEGWQVWLFGSQKDYEISEEISRLAGGGCANLAGKTTLEEAIDLLSVATYVVTNDSGLMHVAAALDRNVIAIYGSSTPTYTPPLSKKAKIVSLNLDCSPCFKRECPLVHYNCLRQLSPDMVLADIRSIQA